MVGIMPVPKEIDDVEEVPETVTAWLRLYSPVFDEGAAKWRFPFTWTKTISSAESPVLAAVSIF
jgi:hypothetical protein